MQNTTPSPITLRKDLKIIFRAYRRMTSSMIHDLAKLGFFVESTKKHYHVFWKNERLHFVTISKTPSDWRSGLNTISLLLQIAA